MRFALIALMFTFIGFLGFYFAFKMGAGSKTEDVAGNKSKGKRAKTDPDQPLLLTQLDELDSLLLNLDFKRAARMLGSIDDLTPRYKSEWQSALDRKDVEEAARIRGVIEDLRAAMS